MKPCYVGKLENGAHLWVTDGDFTVPFRVPNPKEVVRPGRKRIIRPEKPKQQ